MTIKDEVKLKNLRYSYSQIYRDSLFFGSRRDYAPDWPFSGPPLDSPQFSNYVSSLGPGYEGWICDGFTGSYSVSSAAPIRYTVGRILPMNPGIGRKPPRYPRWNPPKFRVPRVPTLPNLADMTARQRVAAIRLHRVKLLRRRERIAAWQTRVRVYGILYRRRLRKYYRELSKYKAWLARPLWSPRGRRAKRGYVVRNDHVKLSFTGRTFNSDVEITSSIVRSGYPNNRWYRSCEVTVTPSYAQPAESASGSRTAAMMFSSAISADPELNQYLNSRCLDKIKQRKVNVAVIIGEGKDTIELASNAVVSFLRLCQSLRKKRVRGVIDAASSLVLLKNLGLDPLIADLGNIATWSMPPVVGRVQSRLKRQVVDYPLPFGKFSGELRFSRTVFYTVDQPLLALASELGLTNPAQLAWELLPLSFVLDYFLKVSDALESLDAMLGLAEPEVWDTVYLNGTLVGTALASIPADCWSLRDPTLDASSLLYTRQYGKSPRPGTDGGQLILRHRYKNVSEFGKAVFSFDKLRFPGSGLDSVKRVSTVISLLLQALPKGPRTR